MASVLNHRLTLAARPDGLPAVTDFTMKEERMPLEAGAGKVLVRVEVVSIDPAMRTWISGIRTYFQPVNIGDLMPAIAVGRVVKSGSPAFKEGDLVRGMLGWQEYALCSAGDLQQLPSSLPASLHLGVLGINGLSAYVALVTIAAIQPNETVLVSTAAGAVGSVAVQLAKLKGCRVVGIAGSDEKCRWVTEQLGADACINYKAVQGWGEVLRKHCPAGIDVYLDNVGGETLIAVLNRMNLNGRITMCGSIESYNQAPPKPIPNYAYC